MTPHLKNQITGKYDRANSLIGLSKLADKAVIGHTALMFLICSHIREIRHQAGSRDFIPFLIQNHLHL